MRIKGEETKRETTLKLEEEEKKQLKEEEKEEGNATEIKMEDERYQ